MPQWRKSLKGIRVTAAWLSLALFLQTAAWLVYDVAERGLPGAWDVWTIGVGGPTDLLPASSSVDLGLGLLQLGTAVAAFLGTRPAGGLLVVTAASTVAFRTPVIWYSILDKRSSPWFAGPPGSSDLLWAVGLTSGVAVALALILGALLLLARQLELAASGPRIEPIGFVVRPMRAVAAVAAVVLGVLNFFYIGRSALALSKSGPTTWVRRLTGQGNLTSLMGVSSGWQWAVLTVLCVTGAVLAARRRAVGDHFAVGLSLFMVLTSFTTLWAALQTSTFFGRVQGDVSLHVFSNLQALLECLGSIAVIGLAVKESMPERAPGFPERGEGGPPEPVAEGAPAQRDSGAFSSGSA